MYDFVRTCYGQSYCRTIAKGWQIGALCRSIRMVTSLVKFFYVWPCFTWFTSLPNLHIQYLSVFHPSGNLKAMVAMARLNFEFFVFIMFNFSVKEFYN